MDPSRAELKPESARSVAKDPTKTHTACAHRIGGGGRSKLPLDFSIVFRAFLRSAALQACSADLRYVSLILRLISLAAAWTVDCRYVLFILR